MVLDTWGTGLKKVVLEMKEVISEEIMKFLKSFCVVATAGSILFCNLIDY